MRRKPPRKDDTPERFGSHVRRALPSAALRVVDALPAAGCGKLAVRLDGGTVLAFSFDHCVGNDIDLFIDDAQALGFLTSRRNDATARLTGDHQEAANASKLVVPEGGVEFIVAAPVTRKPAQDALDVDGWRISFDSIAKILAKKLMYRAARLEPRDVFNLAVALVAAPGASRATMEATR